MALYIKYDLHSDYEAIFESFEYLISEDYELLDMHIVDSDRRLKDIKNSYKDDENDLNNKIKESEDQLNERLKKIEEKESELKRVINNKPRSWLERKLLSFKVALRKFEIKYKLTKSGRAKSIIRKILSILVRVVKWINDKLIKFTRWVNNVPLGNGYKLHHRRVEIKNIRHDIKTHKMYADMDRKFIDKYKNDLKDLKTKSYRAVENQKSFKQSLLDKKKRREGLK